MENSCVNPENSSTWFKTYAKSSLSNSFYFAEGYPKKEVNFAIGQLFEKEWGQKAKGIMHSNCTLPEPNRLFCFLEERKKGWMLTEEYTFSKVWV